MDAIGLIETRGNVASIVALDTMLKTSNVTLLKKEKVKNGFVTIIVSGNVSDVKVAVESAVNYLKNKDLIVVSHHVIARCSDELYYKFFSSNKVSELKAEAQLDDNLELKELESKELESKESESKDSVFEQSLNKESMDEESPKDDVELEDLIETEELEDSYDDLNLELIYDRDSLSQRTVGELRSLARKMKDRKVSGSKIKYMNKEELLNLLSNS